MPNTDHTLRRGPARLLALFLTALVVCSSVLGGFAPQAAYAAPNGCTVSGEAYIADVNALGLTAVKLGQTSLGQNPSGISTNLGLGGILNPLTADVATANSQDTSSGSTAQATSTASIANLNVGSTVQLPLGGLLGGLLDLNVLNVTAGAINVSSVSTATAGSAPTFVGSTNVVNLRINGQAYNGAIAPNTVVPVAVNVPLLGIGLVQVAKVTINEQKFVNGALVVNGLVVEILDGLPAALNLQAGKVVLASATAKAACANANPTGVTITGVSPNSGSTIGGTVVTISGTGLTVQTAATFGGSPATILGASANGTSLTVRTPAHSAGVVDVTVTNPSGSPASATLLGGYTYTNGSLLPSIGNATLSCTNGVISLNITGLGFLTTAIAGVLSPTQVLVNNNIVPTGVIVNPEAGTISAVIGAGLLNQATNTLQLSNGIGLLSNLVNLDLSTISACLNNGGGLSVSGVNPNQGPVGAQTPVLISGSGFQAGATVTFGGQPATDVQVISANVISARTPALTTPGAVNVIVNSGGDSATLNNGYTYVLKPVITTVGVCVSNGVATLTINGVDFLPSVGLEVNNVLLPASAIVNKTASQLTVNVASSLLNLAPGAINSFVAVNAGNILSTAVNLGSMTNACPDPVVSTINPSQGPTTGGTVVTITGSGFQPNTTVTFGGSAGTEVVVANGGNSLTVKSPAHAAGAVDVVVTNPTPVGKTTTITNGFTYVASTSPSPSSSPSASPSTSPNPSTSPFPSPGIPGGNEGVPPTLNGLFLVGTGQVPPTTNGRVTFLATIQDNFALGGIEASMIATGPWQRVVDITSVGANANPFRVAGGFDTTNPAFGGSAAAGNKTVYIRAFDLNNNVSPAQTLTINYPSQLQTFSDVSGDPATVEAINELAARGIIKGYGDGTFGPNDPTARAQMAALIARSMGWGNEEHGNNFPDRGSVDDELWRQVGTLNFYGVARGYTDAATCQSANTTAPCYLPADAVSQVQTISFITRAMVKLGYWTQQADDPTLYPNISAASGHRSDLATWVHYLGAVPGTSPTLAWNSANDSASRAFFALAEWQAVKWRENSANWGVIPRP